MNCPTPPPKRQAVLIVADGDFLEIFSDEPVSIHVARMPQADTRRGERIADACLERMIPPRFRELFDRSKLRGNAIISPLLPSVALQALRTKRAVVALNQLQDELEGDAA